MLSSAASARLSANLKAPEQQPVHRLSVPDAWRLPALPPALPTLCMALHSLRNPLSSGLLTPRAVNFWLLLAAEVSVNTGGLDSRLIEQVSLPIHICWVPPRLLQELGTEEQEAIRSPAVQVHPVALPSMSQSFLARITPLAIFTCSDGGGYVVRTRGWEVRVHPDPCSPSYPPHRISMTWYL